MERVTNGEGQTYTFDKRTLIKVYNIKQNRHDMKQGCHMKQGCQAYTVDNKATCLTDV